MRKLLGIALVGVLAASGCKDSSSSKTQATSSNDQSDTAPNNLGKGRSGKIELQTPRHPSLPSNESDSADTTRERPSLEDFQSRRRHRMEQLDTDGDGKISDEERAAARHKRAEDLLSRSDVNGDGKVTPDELAQGRFRRMKPEELDTNKDGTISVDELDAALEQRSRMWGGGRFGRFGRRFGRGGAPTGAAGSGAQP